MERPTCATCPYWDVFGEESLGEGRHNPTAAKDVELRGLADDWPEVVEGECHRLPPVAGGATDEAMLIHWPRTIDCGWCGEHPDFPAYAAEFAKELRSATA